MYWRLSFQCSIVHKFKVINTECCRMRFPKKTMGLVRTVTAGRDWMFILHDLVSNKDVMWLLWAYKSTQNTETNQLGRFWIVFICPVCVSLVPSYHVCASIIPFLPSRSLSWWVFSPNPLFKKKKNSHVCILFGYRCVLMIAICVWPSWSVQSPWKSLTGDSSTFCIFMLPCGCLNFLVFTGEVSDQPFVCCVHGRCVCTPKVC